MRVLGLAASTAFALAVLTPSAFAQDAAKEKPEGEVLFGTYKCMSCHSVATAGIEKSKKAEGEEAAATAEKKGEEAAATTEKTKKEPPDLSAVGVSHKADWMAAFLMKTEKTKEGKLHMKKFKGTDEELKKLTAWLETLKDEKAAAKATEKTTEKAAEKPAEATETPTK